MCRFVALTTAALAASIAFAAPALAQGKAEAIQRLCPDLTYNQIGSQLADLVQKYDFSSDQDEAAQQAASLLCPSQVAAQEQPRQANTVQPVVQVAPLPRFDLALPRFAKPPRRLPPRVLVIPRLPPSGYIGRRPLPRVVVAGAAGYGGGQYRGESPRALPLTKSVQDAPYCESDDDLMAKMPQGYAPGACMISQIPGKPCFGWKCHRTQ